MVGAFIVSVLVMAIFRVQPDRAANGKWQSVLKCTFVCALRLSVRLFAC